MKGSKLIVLVIVAAVLVLAAWYSARRGRTAAAPAQVGQKLLPNLAVNDIAKLTVTGPGGTATVARTETGWVVPGKYNYPADFDKLRTALRALADLKIGQVMRLTPGQKKDLELLTPSQAGAAPTNGAGTQVSLRDAKGGLLAGLVLGKRHMHAAAAAMPGGYGGYPDSRYVATADGGAYLVAETLDEFDQAGGNWLDTSFVNIAAPDLTRVEIAVTNRPLLTLIRTGAGGELAPEGLATNETVDSSRLSQLTGALGYLRFDDVADPSLAPAQTGLDHPSRIEARTKDGRHYTLRIGSKDAPTGNYFATVSIVYQAPLETDSVATNAMAGGATNAVQRAAAAAEKRKQASAAQEQNDKLSHWIYLLSGSTVESLTPDRASLIKKPEITPLEENKAESAPAAAETNAPAETASAREK